MKKKTGNYPKCIIFELGNLSSLKRAQTNSLFEKGALNMVVI